MKFKLKLTAEQKAQAHQAVKDRAAKIADKISTTRILIWTEKGGEGKSSLAAALAFEFDFPVITNEPRSPLEQILPEGDFMAIEEGDDFPVVPAGTRVIIDCKGAADDAVGAAAQNSDVIIIPVKDHTDHQLFKFLESMQAMIPHNPNIVMVANASKRGKFKVTSKRIREHHPDLPLIEIREGEAFKWIMDEQKPLSWLVREMPANCHSCAGIRDQVFGLAEVVAFEASQPEKSE